MSSSGVRLDPSLVAAALEEAVPQIVLDYFDGKVVLRNNAGVIPDSDFPSRLSPDGLADTIEQLAPVLPSLVGVTSVTRDAAHPAPVEVYGGYLWGLYANQIYRSSDGTAWSLVASVTPGGVKGNGLQALKFTADGQLLACYRGEIYKSIGFNLVAGSVAGWSKVLDIGGGPSSYLMPWGIEGNNNGPGDGSIFIATEYAAPEANWGDSKYVWVSFDSGSTWSIKYTVNPALGPLDLTHRHGVCVDPWASNRLWFVEGHHSTRGVFYSDNAGASWTALPAPDFLVPGGTADWTPTTLTATPEGIVVGTDSRESGVWIIRRTAIPAEMKMEWLLGLPAPVAGQNFFCTRGWYDEDTGLTWMGYSARTPGVAPVLVVTNGMAAHVAWSGPPGDLGDAVRDTVVFKGRVHFRLTYAAEETAGKVATASQLKGTRPELDPGRLAGGVQTHEDRGGVAIGPSKAGFRAVAGGDGAQALGNASSAYGYDCQVFVGNGSGFGSSVRITGSSGSAFGRGAEVTDTNGSAFGNLSKAGLQGTATGSGAEATGTSATADGQVAIASGTRASAFGRAAQATSTDGLALGCNVIVAHTSSVGLAASFTASNQVQLGQRHLELQALAADPSAPASGSLRPFARTNGGGKLEWCIKWPGVNVVTVLATQP